MVRLTLRASSQPVRWVLAGTLVMSLAACGGGDPEQPAAPEAEVPLDTVDTEVGADASSTDALPSDGVESVAADAAASAEGGWQSLQADWMTSMESVQAHFDELSAEELIATGGDREQLVALVQQKYELAPEEAEQQVSDFEATL